MLEDLKYKLKIKLDLSNNVIDAFDYFKYNFGKPNKRCGTASFLQLHLASYLLKTGVIKGIVTAPVSKTALQMAGFPYDGQTEYFAYEFGVKKYGMLAWSDQVKIILVTIHKPLKDVPKLITTEKVLEKIILLSNYLKDYEKIRKPKIGVFSLNPHAFEFTCGAEDKIMKAIQKARKLGITCDGPLPADSAFLLPPHSSLLSESDGYVAMYHDQGMLPVKLLSKGGGVNATLGLPFIRTSPLHGTAFDIAGKGIADPSSMISAIKHCWKLVKTR
ncbi:MAG: 4-hydroxythreonine-4-phosphate dehydrogenase PdxA [Candidatus Latescibacteria bacterium]|nr:4-hydroxythreonine-4-phosphate dehydrogenase PdxA [Candidatus Latescibacterota bacterium]